MTRFVLGLAILFACTSAFAQSAQTITVRNLTLVNLTQVPVEDYQQIVQFALNDKPAPPTPDAISQRVRNALQERGYFRAEVSDPETTLVSESPAEKIVDVSIRVNPGSIYKLDMLGFGGNKAFDVFSAEQLQSHFPISPGDVFDTEKVRIGLDNLRKLYADEGYINFTPTTRTHVVEESKGIFLQINLNPGARFYFGDLKLRAASNRSDAPSILNSDWSSLKGKPYSGTQIEDFMKQHSELLPAGFRECNLEVHQDVKTHTVAVEIVP
jgi:outer membrane protein assembly factor BamA